MTPTRTVRLDRVASSTRNARLSRDVVVGPDVIAREGYVLAVRVLEDKATYNVVEDVSGRMVPLRAGDVLAGTLGARNALRGYAGVVPEAIAPGDTIHVLNLGGVLGRCTSANPEVGPPLACEVLGAVLAFPDLGDRIGRCAHILDGAVPPAERLATGVPVVYVAGTCMNAGKTVAAVELVRGLGRGGRRVAAAKLTGVALMRDALAMTDAGAVAALTFNDAGFASTRPGATVATARGLLNRLAEWDPDVVVAELGDGILGEYGVGDLLAAPDLAAIGAARIVCAADPVGAWGAAAILEERYGLSITAVAGPVTDNEVGSAFVRSRLGVAAHNARTDAAALVATVERALEAWSAPVAAPVAGAAP